MLFHSEPIIKVGICENSSFGLRFEGAYNINATDNGVVYTPLNAECIAFVKGVEIGKDFHWRQQRELALHGSLIVQRNGESSSLVNIIKIEEYLKSVISSEMNANAPFEFLKAHAILSRSWLLHKITHKQTSNIGKISNNNTIIDWTDTEAHSEFDVCADDHCQRYQGISEIISKVESAVNETRGIVLSFSGTEIIDTRFSKCCGGHTELFSTCWQDINPPYLQSVECKWCNPISLPLEDRQKILEAILKDYDYATEDFYKWKRTISAKEIRDNLNTKFSRDIGEILSIEAKETGASGRIKRLQVIGKSGKLIIGKELSIRRLLSDTHLYSSAFTIETENHMFYLSGCGWGHGVGLCQIGAAIMSYYGCSAQQILRHYFPNTMLIHAYE